MMGHFGLWLGMYRFSHSMTRQMHRRKLMCSAAIVRQTPNCPLHLADHYASRSQVPLNPVC